MILGRLAPYGQRKRVRIRFARVREPHPSLSGIPGNLKGWVECHNERI